MLFEDSFTVAQPIGALWEFLLDVERVAPCMPGAELTETIDDRSWKGKVSVKFGPVAMAFGGTVEMTERDDEAHRVSLAAKGTEQKGKGVAAATVTSWLEPSSEGSTKVNLKADITLSGAVAQLSRGLLPEVSRKLTAQFAECLQASMSEPLPGGSSDQAAEVASKPVGGLSLGLSSLWSSIVRFFRKLFGRR